jgi:hypothetical protein
MSLFRQADAKDFIPVYGYVRRLYLASKSQEPPDIENPFVDLLYIYLATLYNCGIGEVFVSSVKGLEHLVQGTSSIIL